MTRRNWILFALTGFLWGIPYLLIKVAVHDYSPTLVVCGRTLIGAAILIPIAMKQGSLRSALKGIRYVIPYAFAEMVGPWILITTAETKITSGLAGLLVATVPIWSTILTSLHGDKSVWKPRRLFGIGIGFVGVIALVGIESITGTSDPLAIGAVILASILYAFATIRVTRALPGVSGIAINGVAMLITGIFYLPLAIIQWPTETPSAASTYSLISLGVFSTAMAFALFFIVMDEIGPARASLVTYMNTAVAVVLGVIILSEPLTLGIIVGLPLVLIGSYFASRKEKV
jgi:drug/metabolite transporter (DMT)-like permease